MISRIYIIGMPGTGKTHFGRILAKSLRMQFADIDELIEKAEGTTIRQIIQDKGEQAFRFMEHEVLKKTTTYNNYVISCGGGTPIHYNNIDIMKSGSIVLWLNTDLDIIKKRISQNITRRPMFVGLEDVEIAKKLKELYENRRKTYAKADVFIEHKHISTIPLGAVIQKVMKIYRMKRK